MAKALALKYRPKGFDELIGQDSVSKTLINALNSGRVSHAYLFSGLRGSGKTSTARIFAKALNCEKGVSSRPCEECVSCLSANENRHIDILEMDAASNRRIDDIRELIEHSKYKPSMGRYKIFIVDEVHMLTKEAFNALLKTLEDPPEYVKFILATTDPLKLPATILSRTQHFRFKKIAFVDVINHLEHILNIENVTYQKDALSMIVRAGEGSLRDTLTLLDQSISYCNGSINVADVASMLGVIDPNRVDEIFNLILKKDVKSFRDLIYELGNYDVEIVIDEFITYLKERYLESDSRFNLMILDRFFRILSDAKSLLQINSNSEFVLLLTLLKLVEALKLRTIDDMINSISSEVVNSSVRELIPTIEENIDTRFNSLINAISRRSSELGECFAKNITFVSFENSILSWQSLATNECKKRLVDSWSVINQLVKEIYGVETVVKTVSNNQTIVKEEIKDNSITSMIEDVENVYLIDTASSKELEINELLNHETIKKTQELFEVTKIAIESKV